MHAPEQLVQPFTDPDWIMEIKMDGYRCMAGIEPGAPGELARVQLRTKSGANCTAWFPEVARALACLPGGPHVLDGEVAVLDENGVSDFNRLQERARKRRWYHGAPLVTYCAFDLLIHDGQDVMALPLTERKARLQALLAPCERGAVMFLGDLPADARVFWAMVGVGLKVEGVVAKRKDSTYQPGVRSPDWKKIKRLGWQEGRIWRG
jgi:bifunctional non-homologous end joining protein LigD